MKNFRKKSIALFLAFMLLASNTLSGGLTSADEIIVNDEVVAESSVEETTEEVVEEVVSEEEIVENAEITESNEETTEETSVEVTSELEVVTEEVTENTMALNEDSIVLGGVDLSTLTDEEFTEKMNDDEWYDSITETEILSETGISKLQLDDIRTELINKYKEDTTVLMKYDKFVDAIDEVKISEEGLAIGFEVEEIDEQGLRTDLVYGSGSGYEYWTAPGGYLSSSSGGLRQRILNTLNAYHSQILSTPYQAGYADSMGSSYNCEGFVEDILTRAGCDQMPMSAFNGGQGWSRYFANTTMAYRTYHIGYASTSALASVIASDGYAEPGDIIFFWDATGFTQMGCSSETAEDGSMLGSKANGDHHVVFYVGNYFNGADWYTMGGANCVWQSNHATSDGSAGNRITPVGSFRGKSEGSFATVFKVSGRTEATIKLKKKASVNGVVQTTNTYDLTGALFKLYATDSSSIANSTTYENVDSLYHFATMITDANGVGHVVWHSGYPNHQINSSYTNTSAPTTVSTSDTHTSMTGINSKTYYFIKEVRAPEGFEIDTDVHKTYIGVNYNDSWIPIEFAPVDNRTNKNIKLKKTSANTAITNNNNCYSLSGAVYAVYDRQSSATSATSANYTTLSGYMGALTTDASGNTNTVTGLDKDSTYYVKEVKAPKGYKLDSTIYSCNMADTTKVVNDVYNLSVTDTPVMDPIAVLVKKQNSKGVGVANAQYTFKFYEGDYAANVDPATLGKTPTRSWVLKTDSTGLIIPDNAHKVSGDAWYIDPSTNNIEFPIGTVTIKETLAPDGYLLDNTTYVRKIGQSGSVITYAQPTFTETTEARIQVQKACAEPSLLDTNPTKFSLSGAKYALFSNQVSAESATESNYTVLSGYVGLMTTDENGLSNKITGLNPGTYYVKEVVAPENYMLDTTVYTVDQSDPLIYPSNTYTVFSTEYPKPEIKTTASDITTNDNIASGETDITVIDKVQCYNLVIGEEYKVSGVIMVQSTDEPLLIDGSQVTAELTFTAEEVNPLVEVTFPTFSSKNLAGESIVVFESLYHKGIEVAVHTDITDKDQTIDIPNVGTKAWGKDERPERQDNIITVVDKVMYTNLLLNGKSYTVDGVLMVTETGKPLLDKDGKKVTATKTFVPTEKDGFVELEFTFDADLLEGSPVTVFEDLKYEGITVKTHADLTDRDQTVVFPCFNKVDSETGEYVEGAELAIYDSNDKLVTSWITTKDVRVIKDLEVGTYTLREVKAPDGYYEFDEIEFKITDEKIRVVVTAEDDAVKGKAHLIKVDDKKADKTLAGVTFNLYKTADSVIDSSVDKLKIEEFNALSKKEQDIINGYKVLEDDLYIGTYTTDKDGEISVDELTHGQYYFKETETQKGYKLLPDDIGFIIDKENLDADLEVSNEGRVGWIDYNVSTKGQPNDRGRHIRTGDYAHIAFASILMLISLLGIILAVKKKKGVKFIIAIPLMLAIFNVASVDSYAKEETADKHYTETKEDTYDTDDESKYNFDFAEEIEKDGAKYKLEGITYEKKCQYDALGVEISESVSVVEDDVKKDFEPKKTIKENGYTYQLKDFSIDVKSYTPTEITYSYDTEYVRSKPTPNPTANYTYVDEETGESYDVVLPLISSELISKGYNIPVTLTGTLYDYDAEYIVYNGTQYDNPGENLGSIEPVLMGFISSSGYNTNDYNNVRYGYSGEPYTNSDGLVCRNYYVNFDVYGEMYRFHYGDTFNELIGVYEANCVYELDSASKAELDKLKNTYDVTATADYKQIKADKKADKKKSFLQTTVGKAVLAGSIILALLIIIALALYIIKGGRKDTDYTSKRDAKRDFDELNQ